ncbi:hypothetical protein EPA93_39845 [Ktedonosporobacter rubrisoli]|uniref:Uncharacterized protein n=1 Tax=Ktedonosporobacter rubrisoli TaxID=2509675 RepID=A0A4P6K1Q4_KTERU|nr:hypothetical protein [Ktedonosporobacter rubrisoli]QBD81802.1 hypothetical protein EPA93_39845 [Ktedonosporobacter rubrisoli]
MEEIEELGDLHVQSNVRNPQLVIVAQLLQQIATMQNIDELLRWIAQAIVQFTDAQVVQFWSQQANRVGEYSTDLRTIVCQDVLLPQHFIINFQTEALATRMLQEQHGPTLLQVENIFYSHQAILVKRYGLNYCSGYFIHSRTLLPPMRNDTSTGKIATPLKMAAVFFFRQPPSQKLLFALGYILEHMLQAAKQHGLLCYPAHSSPTTTPLTSLQPSLAELIPQRLTSWHGSPHLSLLFALPSKQARHVHTAIDGQRNIQELAQLTGLDIDTIYTALQELLGQQRIRLCEPGGQPIDSMLLLNAS